MGAAFGMNSKDIIRLQDVRKAEFIARENLGRYNRPFAGIVHQFPGPAVPFTDTDRRRMMTPFLATLPWTPAVPLDRVEHALKSATAGAVPARMPTAFSQGARDLALDILSYPWDFLHVRYKRLNASGRPGQQAKNELVTLGLVKEHAIPRKGRPPILLEPLPALAAATGQPLPNWGKGGYLHAFVIHAVMTKLNAMNYANIKTEAFFGSKAIDLVATDPSGNLIGVEVSITLTNLLDNAEKNFLVQPRLARLLIVCIGLAEVRQAERAITFAPGLKQYLPRIQVEAVAKWL